jgi:hypothetical protein
MYSEEQLGFDSSNEHSPSARQAGAAGFDFRSQATDLNSFLSAAVGHRQIVHDPAGYNPNESDDDDMSEESGDIDEEDDDEHSNGDDSSGGGVEE